MAKRKSTTDETPAADAPAVANGDVSGSSKKRRRLSDAESAAKKPKKEKKSSSKKERKAAEAEDEQQEEQAAPEAEEENAAAAAAAPAESKKKQKKNKKGKKNNSDSNNEEAAAAEGGEGEQQQEGDDENTKNAGGAKKSRWIVFVGNIPYSATVADIERHFSAVQPISVRLLHEKTNPSKSRGIAFVEFGGFDHMKTCLKTMHHTIMRCTPKADPRANGYKGRNIKQVEERQINVELTAGGGGAKDNRKEKIRAKNEKLTAERERRAVEEERVRIKKEQERLAKEGERKGGQDGVHPSRRNRVPGNSRSR